MSELVADCPRCGSAKITFDLTQDQLVDVFHDWQRWYEAFCICRRCLRSTIFLLSYKVDSSEMSQKKIRPVDLPAAVNRYMNIEGIISLKDTATVSPPEFLPVQVDAVFKEGATCLSVGCYNAAATMFRLCIDIATRGMLPNGEAEGLNSKVRGSLGLRLPWLFQHGQLPTALQDLSTCCVKDGNDGAHEGTLQKSDAEDLLDFTTALLERIYTEPERVRLAQVRRAARRAKQDT
ncbi:MAG: DUF4145 domain-containing protein [Dehalococcoidia bacterium]|nr:DUF4145 domain-containing protein [Dehalococcoidia bacterium]